MGGVKMWNFENFRNLSWGSSLMGEEIREKIFGVSLL
jgi:hypothetical protein